MIGGIAAILHGVPRSTFDLDLLIATDTDNAERLLKALNAAKFGTAELIAAEELLDHEITVFEDWVRVDVQTSTPGLDFDKAWKDRLTMTYQGQELYVASLEDLISSKTAAGRKVDLEDVAILKLKAEQR